MPVEGRDATGGTNDSADGEDIDSLQFGSETWWIVDADWAGEGWDFDTVWKWDSGKGLPVLR